MDCSYDGPNRGMRIREKNGSCHLRLMSCIQLLPNKIKNRIISRSVESPLEFDGFLFITRTSLSQMKLSQRFLFGLRTNLNSKNVPCSILFDCQTQFNSIE